MWRGDFLKRQFLFFSLSLLAISAQADFRVGVQCLIFRPDVAITSGSQEFNRFDGAGVELGWVCRHCFDVGFAIHGAYARPPGELAMSSGSAVRKTVVLVTELFRPAFRFDARSAPYLGVGFGQVVTFTNYKYSAEASNLDHTATYGRFVWVPFAGYDFRRSRRFGLKLEGQYQPRDVVYIQGFTLLGEAYLAW